jgi:hypothetical protein
MEVFMADHRRMSDSLPDGGMAYWKLVRRLWFTLGGPALLGGPNGVKHVTQPVPARFLLWIDAVGGFLVCRGDEVVLGQPIPGSNVDVPILGDLSRRHATIRRDGEGYLLEPGRKVGLNGREVKDAALLRDGDAIELGDTVRLKFRRPHPLSATARLDFVSNHRTQPSADAVLLMAESCVLGPNPTSHVVCRDWQDDVVLYRQGSGLACRSAGGVTIDGVKNAQRGTVGANSRIVGSDFALSLEPL